jgi:hypothetical protein
VNAVGQPSNPKWPRYAAFSAAFTPDGSRLALANPESGDVKIWDVATGKEPLPTDRGLGRAAGYSLMTPFLRVPMDRDGPIGKLPMLLTAAYKPSRISASVW